MRILPRPTISVILPSYNHVNFVEQAVKSVLEQTEKNIELIIIDDGSTDGTDKVIEKIKDDRIRFIRFAENRKVHPRNLGLSIAVGDFVAFQNSDDVWKKDKLKKQLQQFESNKNLVCCFTGVEIISKNGTIVKRREFSTNNMTPEEWLRRFFDKNSNVCLSSALVKRSAFKKTGVFDESLVQSSDRDLWIRMALVGEFFIIEDILTQMRIVKNQNLDTHNPATERRRALERTIILERYVDGKVKLEKVFPEIIKLPNLSQVVKLAYLANYAWTLSPEHKLFSDRLLSSLISTTKNRSLITTHFGPDLYSEFAKRRTEIEVIVYE